VARKATSIKAVSNFTRRRKVFDPVENQRSRAREKNPANALVIRVTLPRTASKPRRRRKQPHRAAHRPKSLWQ